VSRRIEGQCAGCGVAAVETLCPACLEEAAVYQQWRARRKGMPRQFIGYLDLLSQWKKRRDECKGLRKETDAARATAAVARQELKRVAAENAAAKLLLEGDAGKLALEVVELREKLRATSERFTAAQGVILDGLRKEYHANGNAAHRAIHAAIPENMLKPLRALCHPDRWQGTPQQGIATRVMQWLNGGADHA
jgi:hypothetical protein